MYRDASFALKLVGLLRKRILTFPNHFASGSPVSTAEVVIRLLLLKCSSHPDPYHFESVFQAAPDYVWCGTECMAPVF